MSTFSENHFPVEAYANLRPEYLPSLYELVLNYHRGPRTLCIDLGSGHGTVLRCLSPHFSRIVGIDPSKAMLEKAISMTNTQEHISNASFVLGSAESCDLIESDSVELVVAGQAAHWFHYEKTFAEMGRVVKSGGTLAFWGYEGLVFIGHPKATAILEHFCYANDEDLLGPYWIQPGRSILRGMLRDCLLPEEDWEDMQRIEYEPCIWQRRSGTGTIIVESTTTIGECMKYIRTWSSFFSWQKRHPGEIAQENGGIGDLVDRMFHGMVDEEEDWKSCEDWKALPINIEWRSVLILARRI